MIGTVLIRTFVGQYHVQLRRTRKPRPFRYGRFTNPDCDGCRGFSVDWKSWTFIVESGWE